MKNKNIIHWTHHVKLLQHKYDLSWQDALKLWKSKNGRIVSGSGILDVLKDPVGTIKEAFSGVPTKLNNISTKTVKEFGNYPITKILIARTPLSNALEGAINAISLGKFKELKDKYGYDKLFHLSLIITVNSTDIIYEKNEVITIEPLSMSKSIKPSTELLNVPVLEHLTLYSFVENTRYAMGDNKFYDYDAFKNNCQDFILQSLKANSLLNQEAKNFLLQDVSGIKKDLDNSSYSYVPKVVKSITNLGSFVSRLVGKGSKKKDVDKLVKLLIKSVKNNKFKFL